MKFPLPLLAAAGTGLAAGLIIGLAAGGISSGPHASPAEPTAPTSPMAPAAPSGEPGPRTLASSASGTRLPAPAGSSGSVPASLSELRRQIEDIAILEGGPEYYRQWAALVDRLKVSDLSELTSQMLAGSTSADLEVWPVLLGIYAEKDPAGALQAAQKLPAGMRSSGLYTVITAVAAQDPEQALAMIQTLEDKNQQTSLRSMVGQALAAKDPARAFEIARRTQGGSEMDFPLYSIFSQWALSDMAAAQAAARQLQGQEAQQAQSAILSRMAQTDPRAALQSWQALPDSPFKNQTLNSLIDGWNQQDLAGALEAVIEHMPMGNNFSQAINNVFNRWAAQDPAAAAAGLGALPPGEAYESAAGYVASSWASSGAYQDALQWAQSLQNEQTRASALGTIFSQWGQRDISQAVAAVTNLPPAERASVAPTLVQSWAQSDLSAALAWAQSFSEPTERQRVLQVAVGTWANSAPLAAAQYALQQPPENRGKLVTHIMHNWGSRDPESAAAWLAQQPNGAWRDGATAVLARSIAREDGAAALQWANTITDAERRTSELTSLYRNWQRSDPEAARQWLARANLSAEQKKQMQP